MRIVKRFINILSYICYIGIAIYILVSIPIVFGYKPLVVLSGSMEPTYKVGAIIYYEETKDIQKDDVIVFGNSENPFVTHRVVEIKNNKYVTKGDANESNDAEAVAIQNVKGKAIDFNIPYLGYYIQYVNTNLWLIVAVIIILVSEFLISNLKIFDINLDKEEEDEK